MTNGTKKMPWQGGNLGLSNKNCVVFVCRVVIRVHQSTDATRAAWRLALKTSYLVYASRRHLKLSLSVLHIEKW